MFIHPMSDVQSKFIGTNTNVWQFCVILDNARIGDNCNICSNVFIENDVLIGNNVTFCNDRHPKSGNKNWKLENIIIKMGASIGANSTILSGVTIGKNSH